jgi:hypothetical protein
MAWVAPWSGILEGQTVTPPPQPKLTGPPPKVVVDKDSYDFGAMDFQTAGEHDFVFRNKGAGPLRLTKGETTCKCTLANLDTADVLPGALTKVTVKWTPKAAAESFSQTAAILTNDPEHPRVVLRVSGRVTSRTRVVPSELVFPRITAGDEVTGSVRVYGFRAEDKFAVTGFQLSDKVWAKFFNVQIKPLAAALVKAEPDAKAGWEIRVVVKPGLPVGPFRQRIQALTNVRELAAVEIPIQGTVTSDITIAGPGFDDNLGVLMIGTIGREGTERRLQITVRGPSSQAVKFDAEEVFPSYLQVKVGKPMELSGGTVSMTPVTIGIPAESAAGDFMGSDVARLARVTLKTHLPKSPQLRIYIRFAVGG